MTDSTSLGQAVFHAITSGGPVHDSAPAPDIFAVPCDGELTPIAPGIAWGRLPLHYAPHHVNIYVLDDGDGWLVVDTGVDSTASRESWLALISGPLSSKPITRILVTHWHNDHLGMAGWLARRTGATLLISDEEHQRGASQADQTRHARDARERRYLLAHGAALPVLDRWLAEGFQNMSMISPLPETYIPIGPRDPVRVGKRTFQILPLSGHSPLASGLHCSEDHIFICGDQLSDRLVPPVAVMSDQPDANPYAGFIASMDLIRRSIPEDTLILPGHEEPFRGVAAALARQATKHTEVCNRLLKAAHEPQSARELVSQLSRSDPGSTWFGFVVSRVVAYAHLLLAWGHLSRVVTDGRIYFTTTLTEEIEISQFLPTAETETTP
ncbi:MBL fold metallo-hydrolase [Cryobacterium sp. Hh11]|nr:MBL fold metallo-hydrolase [Cryobacterium sp. Hh11]